MKHSCNDTGEKLKKDEEKRKKGLTRGKSCAKINYVVQVNSDLRIWRNWQTR